MPWTPPPGAAGRTRWCRERGDAVPAEIGQVRKREVSEVRTLSTSRNSYTNRECECGAPCHRVFDAAQSDVRVAAGDDWSIELNVIWTNRGSRPARGQQARYFDVERRPYPLGKGRPRRTARPFRITGQRNGGV